ncbi:MAG TPA: TIGR03960 family B12-binding radical SAM protein [Syntrophomonadaceae bacterium]|nr:TIGR03960 family B12-binding radical SAM protein [Syntrophomonadaceae bacterium]
MKDRLFREILPRVAKPARYTGGEYNILQKDWDQARARMVLAFPDVYEVGMSHVGSKILYGLVNEKSPHLIERTYAPWPDMEELMRSQGLPLYALESFRPVRDFDVVGFSLLYELSISNVLNMLNLAGIPIWSRERMKEQYPLIIAGGPVVFNPEPFADFFDAFIIGDGEEALLEVLDLVDRSREWSKGERLAALAALEGVYVPCLYQVSYREDGTLEKMEPLRSELPDRVRKRVVIDLENTYFPERPLVPNLEIIHDRAVLEVMRGCQRGCRFCHAGMVYRPVRERSPELLKKQAEEQLHHTGYEEISLTSLSTLDYSAVAPLVKDLVKGFGPRGVGVSLPSLRVDAFSIELANEVQKVRKTTLTLAPEAGTQRLRDVINKNVDEEQLFKAVEAAFLSGWLSVKLYFMYGLPSETEEDLLAILELVQKVKAIGDRCARRPVEIRTSLACFVPKAHTPFQWRAQDNVEQLESKRRRLNVQRRRGIKLSFHDSRLSYLEGVIARGDRRLSQGIYRAWEKGCKFDGWSEHFHYETWIEAMAEAGLEMDFYTRERSYAEILPWDFIDIGVGKDYLMEENEKATYGETTGDCRWEGCGDCGICPTLGVNLDIKGADRCI